MGKTARKTVSMVFVLTGTLVLACPAAAQVALELSGESGVVLEPAGPGEAPAGDAPESLALPAAPEAELTSDPEAGVPGDSLIGMEGETLAGDAPESLALPAAPEAELAPEPEAGAPSHSLIRMEGETLADDQRALDYELAIGKPRSNAGIETMAELANAYLNLPEDRGVTPYIGGGIGYAIVTVDRFGTLDFDPLDASGGLLAYQLRAGFAVGLLPHTEITLGYRYFVTEDLNVTVGSSDRGRVYEYDAHVGELGIRITF